MPPDGAAEAALRTDGLRRDFGAVRALDDVSLAFQRGAIHGLVGENGAGKSTLMKIISGMLPPSAGRVLIDGEAIERFDPAHARARGVAMVHQELNLVDELDVAGNIYLGREPTRRGLIDRRQLHRQAREQLQRIGCSLRPDQRVGELPIAQRQMVEIGKAIACDARVLILDEPTAVLGQVEMELLFALMRRLRSDGVCIIYISHHLNEVMDLCDRVSVLRDGRVIRSIDHAEIGHDHEAEQHLAALMVGRPLGEHFPPRQPPGDEIRLRVDALCSRDQRVRDVSFELRGGEILGIAGLVGAGRSELGETLFGLRRRDSGAVQIDGQDVPADQPASALAHGLAYLSEDRRSRGLVLGRSIRENAALVALRRYGFLIHTGAERRRCRAELERLQVVYAALDDPIESLSGGNQQKVALGKWLAVHPRVLVLDEPTRGVDVGAKEEIYRLIAELAAGGMGCVVISSELMELLGLCHRIAVMRAGRMVTILDAAEASEEWLMYHAAGLQGAGAA